MSEYRDDRSAARLRIETLEARIAEQQTEIERRDAELAARDETIDRLHRGHERPPGYGYRAESAARASRALGLCIVTMTSLAVVAHLSQPVQPAPHMWILHAPALDEGEAGLRGDRAASREEGVVRGAILPPMFHADPPPRSPNWSDLRDPFAEQNAESAPPRPTVDGPMPIQRRVDPRVWGRPANTNR